MQFSTLNGITIGYRLDGRQDGPPLVLLNSLGTDARIWDAVIAVLGTEFRILSYDQRGQGLSGVPAGPYTLDDHVADLAALATHLGFNRFALCGVSIGGMIAQRFAVLHPGRLDALVLCNTAARIGDEAFWTARIAAVEQAGLAAISGAVLERWFSPDFRTERPANYSGYRNLLERAPRAGYIGNCAAIRDADLHADAPRIAAPTLVVAGEFDRSTPPELVRGTAALIPGARYVLIDGAGHIPSIEQPEQLASLIATHLKGSRHA